MPWYDYQCKECGRDFPIQHSIHDEARETEEHMNPKGKKSDGKLKRLISPAAVVWKDGPPTGKHYVYGSNRQTSDGYVHPGLQGWQLQVQAWLDGLQLCADQRAARVQC